MGGSESKHVINDTQFYVSEHGDKYANLGWISLGFFLAWIVIGAILAFYVNSQIDPKEAKMRSSHTWYVKFFLFDFVN